MELIVGARLRIAPCHVSSGLSSWGSSSASWTFEHSALKRSCWICESLNTGSEGWDAGIADGNIDPHPPVEVLNGGGLAKVGIGALLCLSNSFEVPSNGANVDVK